MLPDESLVRILRCNDPVNAVAITPDGKKAIFCETRISRHSVSLTVRVSNQFHDVVSLFDKKPFLIVATVVVPLEYICAIYSSWTISQT